MDVNTLWFNVLLWPNRYQTGILNEDIKKGMTVYTNKIIAMPTGGY